MAREIVSPGQSNDASRLAERLVPFKYDLVRAPGATEILYSICPKTTRRIVFRGQLRVVSAFVAMLEFEKQTGKRILGAQKLEVILKIIFADMEGFNCTLALGLSSLGEYASHVAALNSLTC